jgi:hypothetical protein
MASSRQDGRADSSLACTWFSSPEMSLFPLMQEGRSCPSGMSIWRFHLVVSWRHAWPRASGRAQVNASQRPLYAELPGDVTAKRPSQPPKASTSASTRVAAVTCHATSRARDCGWQRRAHVASPSSAGSTWSSLSIAARMVPGRRSAPRRAFLPHARNHDGRKELQEAQRAQIACQELFPFKVGVTEEDVHPAPPGDSARARARARPVPVTERREQATVSQARRSLSGPCLGTVQILYSHALSLEVDSRT